MKGKARISLLCNGNSRFAITNILLGILSLLLLEVAVHAQPPSYGGIKLLAEQHDPTNSIPQAERIYFCTRWPIHEESFIRRFQDGLTIRQLIDQTKFKGKEVEVTVYRAHTQINFGREFYSVVNPTNTPTFQLKAEDAVLLMDPTDFHAF